MNSCLVFGVALVAFVAASTDATAQATTTGLDSLFTNVAEPFTIDLHQQAYTFKKGHRIMVQVQSTWFPLYDRNPQTFVPNISPRRRRIIGLQRTGFSATVSTPRESRSR